MSSKNVTKKWSVTSTYYYFRSKRFPSFSMSSFFFPTNETDGLPIPIKAKIELIVKSRKKLHFGKNCNYCRFFLMFMHFNSFVYKFFYVKTRKKKTRKSSISCRAHHNCRLDFKLRVFFTQRLYVGAISNRRFLT